MPNGTKAGPDDLPARLPQPLTDADYLYDGAPPAALVDLGRALFFDPILSGNRNISCATCHDAAFGTSDGLALGIGEGGTGAGPARITAAPVTGRVPRNAQALWNIGARAYTSMFHDGRLETLADPVGGTGLRSPEGSELPDEVPNLLAAQAFFPVTSPVEMAGQRGENRVALLVADRRKAEARAVIAGRVAGVPAYATRFAVAFDEIAAGQPIGYRHIGEAVAGFQTVAFRSDGSPFDAVLKTRNPGALVPDARAGMALFYGKAGCADCHSGPLLTDHRFHAIAVPQIGPGKAHGADMSYWRETGFMGRLEDEGRYRVTFDESDLFAFRTPSLRNVALTGPWGHSGAFSTLEGMVRHHLDATVSLEGYDPAAAGLPRLAKINLRAGRGSQVGYRPVPADRRPGFDRRDAWVHDTPALRARIAAANALDPVALTDVEVAELLAFLQALTDPEAVARAARVPDRVPSGLRPGEPETTPPSGS
ncbi:MAG: cytochrome-c peroxidase [Maritimibacter sp.]|nr:cytochrome-c peroxidase [Maritimibacter sp.]